MMKNLRSEDGQEQLLEESILNFMKSFELILRLKGNYIWPAMWGKAFYDDDL
jgi:hypothetical protein